MSFTLHGGAYDIGRNAELRAELDLIEPQSDVVIDLGSTEYFDCSSIGVLIGKLKEWNRREPETRLRLHHVNSHLANMFRLLELDEIFIIE